MKARYFLLTALALWATGCVQDPEAPNNLPEMPTLSVDETSLTRVSMVATGTFGNMADVTAYGVEISETLFENGGTYTTLVPQEVGEKGFSLGVSDLKPNSTYFLRAFITNGHSRMYSGTLTQKTPETSVASVSDVSIKDDYYLVATLEDNGGRAVEDVGFMWGTSSERKDIKREKRYPGTLSEDGKTFTLPLNEVGEGTHYIMAYAEDDKDGTGYSRIPFEWVVTADQGVAIEDPNFKKYLLMYHDGNEDGKMSYAEMEAIESIDVHTDNIKTVREINMMPRLRSLYVSGTQSQSGLLTSLDVSRNTGLSALDCSNNKLVELNASMIPGLHYLDCLGNPMEVLYLSYYQEFEVLRYPEGCRIVYVDAPDNPVNPTAQPNNEIWYTSTDGKVVEPTSSGADDFGAAIVSNTYENGKGIIQFDGEVRYIMNPQSNMSDQSPFNAVQNLVSISLPESVSQVNDFAFYKCPNLQAIQFPSSLDRLGAAVCDCPAITEIFIPETRDIGNPVMNTVSLERFTGPYASADGRYLVKNDVLLSFAPAGMGSFEIPEGIVSVGSQAFWGCTELAQVSIPTSVTAIGNQAFCQSGLTGIDIPYTVETIGGAAFGMCYSLTYASIGGKKVTFSDDAFGGCISLERFEGAYASADGRLLVEGTKIWSFAQGGLESYEIPEGIVDASFGFSDYPLLPALSTLVLPSTLQSLNLRASALTSLVCKAQNPPSIVSDLYLPKIETVHVPEQAVQSYMAAQYWSEYANFIQPIQEQGGNVLPDFTAQKYLSFVSDGTTTISLENYSGNAPALYYSFDAQSWMQWDYSALSFSTNKPLYLCGINPDGFSLNYDSFSQFSFSGDPFTVSGDIMSLINKDQDVDTIPSVYCFQRLFYGSYIKSAPSLPATNLTEGCYSEMFENCIYLTAAPSLPATILAPGCYQFMFHGCTYLVTAPELPATSLAVACYQSMFRLCTSLESAPELSAAVVLPEKAYNKMFADCEHINYIKCLAADVTATDCVVGWLSGVSESGTFVKSADAQGWIEGYDGIPVGWTVLNDGQQQGISATKYLYISSIGNSTLSFFSEGDNAPVLYYSFDRVQWTQWDFSPLEFSNDMPVYIFGDNPQGFSHNPQVYSSFVAEGADIIVNGSVMSLLNGNEELLTIPCDYCFYRLFADCVPLYTAPSLPATTLTTGCYAGMFSGCSKLYHLPEELPAETLAEQCYADMFSGCLLLTASPSLWAASLPAGCYARMFQGCLGLSDVECRAMEFLSDTCTEDWLDGVAQTGIFHCAAGVQWPSGPSGIPEGWEVQAN